MTREEAIKEIKKVFVPAYANGIITALTEGATESEKSTNADKVNEVTDEQMKREGEVKEAILRLWPVVEEMVRKLAEQIKELEILRAAELEEK